MKSIVVLFVLVVVVGLHGAELKRGMQVGFQVGGQPGQGGGSMGGSIGGSMGGGNGGGISCGKGGLSATLSNLLTLPQILLKDVSGTAHGVISKGSNTVTFLLNAVTSGWFGRLSGGQKPPCKSTENTIG